MHGLPEIFNCLNNGIFDSDEISDILQILLSFRFSILRLGNSSHFSLVNDVILFPFKSNLTNVGILKNSNGKEEMLQNGKEII